jgi:hypothetical protein
VGSSQRKLGSTRTRRGSHFGERVTPDISKTDIPAPEN